MMYPQDLGFTPRYEWHGQHRVIIWRHCGRDAAQGDREVLVSSDSLGLPGPSRLILCRRTVVLCRACGLRCPPTGAQSEG